MPLWNFNIMHHIIIVSYLLSLYKSVPSMCGNWLPYTRHLLLPGDVENLAVQLHNSVISFVAHVLSLNVLSNISQICQKLCKAVSTWRIETPSSVWGRSGIPSSIQSQISKTPEKGNNSNMAANWNHRAFKFTTWKHSRFPMSKHL